MSPFDKLDVLKDDPRTKARTIAKGVEQDVLFRNLKHPQFEALQRGGPELGKLAMKLVSPAIIILAGW